jgi:hypothetical protein
MPSSHELCLVQFWLNLANLVQGAIDDDDGDLHHIILVRWPTTHFSAKIGLLMKVLGD